MTTQSLKEDARPATLWYWDDWFAEFGLRLCSLAARGLWMDMLGIMFRAEIRGTLTVNGRQIDSKALAKILGEDKQTIDKLLAELEENDAFSRIRGGTIICRRMFNESKRKKRINKIRSEAGQRGAEARWQADSKDDSKKMAKMALSSSSSSSVSFPISYKNLTNLLIEKIKQNDSKAKVPKEGTKRHDDWINNIRKIIELDKRSEEEIEAAIRFSQEDDFWKGNILSTAKLRKQIATLLHQAQRYKPDEIGKAFSREKNPEEEKRSVLIEKKRSKLYEKHKPDLDNADTLDKKRDIEALIATQVATYSRQLEGEG